MDELAQYLIEKIIVDFDGEVNTETVREFLRKDSSPTARALLQKIIEEKGIDDLMLALADCLTANIAASVSPDVIREHLLTYSES